MNASNEHAIPRPLTGVEEQLLQRQRRWLHQHPELAFNEFETSAFVAGQLRELGLEPDVGLARTGIVATIHGRGPGRSVGLRADMDALPVIEATGVEHASRTEGLMHACGHDGHTAILLGAARLLAENRDFAGKIHLVFQPAEENEGGGRVMVEEGLFDQYPMDAIFGLHNWPGLPLGTVAVMPGPMMASFDVFEITVTGAGGHAAMPHKVDDVVVAGSAITTALQTIISRRLDPLLSGVVSVTQIQAGSAWNVLPDRFVLKGCCRAFGSRTQELTESSMREIASGVGATYNVSVEVKYERRLPATVNNAACAQLAASCARAIVGPGNVRTNIPPSMAGEDFSFMLDRCPGAYLWLGIGEHWPALHSSRYDFDDRAIGPGSRLLAAIALESLRHPSRFTRETATHDQS